MSDDILSKLNQAFDHVEAGRLDDAIDILKPVLDAAPDNADAWWIYLHAVSDPVEARRALQNVIRIAPDYPGATEMLRVLNVQSPVPAIKPLSPPPMSMPEAPPSMPETPAAAPVAETRPKFEEVTKAPAASLPPAPANRRSMLPTLIVAAVVIIALIVIAALVLPGMQTQPTATATLVVASDSTETPIPVQVEASATVEVVVADETDEALEPTATPEVESTSVVVEPAETSESAETAEATDDVTDVTSGGIDAALVGFSLAPDGVTDEEIGDAPSVIANVCSTPGREVRTLLPQVMEALASAADSLPEGAGIGTRLINCADGTTLVTVIASRDSVEQYAAGTLTTSEFASSWTPVR